MQMTSKNKEIVTAAWLMICHILKQNHPDVKNSKTQLSLAVLSVRNMKNILKSDFTLFRDLL